MGHRCPGSVLDECHLLVGEIPLGKVVDELPHPREDAGVVCGCGQHYLAVAERILHSLGHVAPCQVVHHNLGAALGLQLVGQQLHGLLGVAVDRGVCNYDSVGLDAVG